MQSVIKEKVLISYQAGQLGIIYRYSGLRTEQFRRENWQLNYFRYDVKANLGFIDV